MSFLRRFTAGFVRLRTGRVFVTVGRLDERLGLFERVLGKVDRVGTHVSDETDRLCAADLHAFIEILCDPHRALGAEAEGTGGLLLQRARGKRRSWALLGFAACDLRYGVRRTVEIGLDLHRQRLVVDNWLALLTGNRG